MLLQLLLTRTSVGLHMRAAAMDFRTARLLGVRANRVVGGAVFISGLLAAVCAVMLTVQQPARDADLRARRHDRRPRRRRPRRARTDRSRRRSAASRSASRSGLLGGALPTNQSQYLPTFLFAAVILVLLVRPNGLFVRADAGGERV